MVLLLFYFSFFQLKYRHFASISKEGSDIYLKITPVPKVKQVIMLVVPKLINNKLNNRRDNLIFNHWGYI